jgi:hypothetical protein
VKVISSALERRIQVTIEGMKGVEFAGLDRLNEEDLLRCEPFMVHTFGLVRRYMQ